MTSEQIRENAKNIRVGLIFPHPYDEKYGDLKVADLLLVLEDNNLHTSETILTALATLDIDLIAQACEILVEQNKQGHLASDLYAKRQQLRKEIENA